MDEIDKSGSSLPVPDQVKTIISDNKDCAGKSSSSGSITLESQRVGFLCDNPTSPTVLSEVGCDKCFNQVQCQLSKINQFFPIRPSQRTATVAIKSKGKFSITFGVKFEKALEKPVTAIS